MYYQDVFSCIIRPVQDYCYTPLGVAKLNNLLISILLLCTGTQIKSWLDSMRTRYGRITERKSGQGTPRYTERDRWILSNFGFLKDHIVRQAGRQSSQVCIDNHNVLHIIVLVHFQYHYVYFTDIDKYIWK